MSLTDVAWLSSAGQNKVGFGLLEAKTTLEIGLGFQGVLDFFLIVVLIVLSIFIPKSLMFLNS